MWLLASDWLTSVESVEPGLLGLTGRCSAPELLAERRGLEADLTPDWMVGSVKRSSDRKQKYKTRIFYHNYANISNHLIVNILYPLIIKPCHFLS